MVINKEDGYNYILENKTVDSSRFGELVGSADMDTQFTGQIFLAKHLLPSFNIQGVLLNCLKKRVGKANPEKVFRKPVYRSPQALEKFRLDIVRTLDQIDTAISEYDELVLLGMSPYEAANQKFDERGGRDCHWCSYKDICMNPTKAEAFAGPFLPRSTQGFLKEHEV